MRSKRKMIVVLLGAALLCTTATPEAQAKPSFGSNCLSCHDYDGNIMEVTGHDDVIGHIDGNTQLAGAIEREALAPDRVAVAAV